MRKRWVGRDLRENALEHCVEINLEKKSLDLFKPSVFILIVLKIGVRIE